MCTVTFKDTVPGLMLPDRYDGVVVRRIASIWARRKATPRLRGDQLARRAVTVFNDLPRLTRDGFVLVVAGGLMDTAYHLTPARQGVLEWAGLMGHLVTLLGMLIAMAGVLSVGLRKRHL